MQEAPQAVAQIAEGAPNSPDAQAIAPRNFPPQETLQKPQVADRSPDTTTLRKGAVEAASREKAKQVDYQRYSVVKCSVSFYYFAVPLQRGSIGILARTVHAFHCSGDVLLCRADILKGF